MPVSLTEDQKSLLTQWIAEGASVGEIQKRLAAQFSLNLTFMDTRFLLDDHNLTPKDAPKPAPAPAADLANTSTTTPPPPASPLAGVSGAPGEAAPVGRVRVTVDKVVRPGAVVSGSVVFSDGQTSEWYLDQTGRLGLVPKTKGYQPKPADVQEFQYTLQDELARLGY